MKIRPSEQRLISWTPDFAKSPNWLLLDNKSEIVTDCLTFEDLVTIYKKDPEKYSAVAFSPIDDLTLVPNYSVKQTDPSKFQEDCRKFIRYLCHSGTKRNPDPHMVLLDTPFEDKTIRSLEYTNKSISSQLKDGIYYWVFKGYPFVAANIPDKGKIRKKHEKLIDKICQDKEDGEAFKDLYFYNIDASNWELGARLLRIIIKHAVYDADRAFEIFQGSSVMHPMWMTTTKSGHPKGIEFIRKNLKERRFSKKSTFQEIEGFLRFYYDLRYNEVTERVELLVGGKFLPMSDYQLNSIHRHLKQKGAKIGIRDLKQLLESDFTKKFHPFRSYFESLPPLDESDDPISELADTVKTTDQDYFKWTLKKWLVAAAGCAVDKDVVNHQLLALMGGQQGSGKSTWLELLLPPKLTGYRFSGTIDPSSKDSQSYLAECFLINLDELDSLSKKKEAELKEIITKKTMRYRVPYGHFNQNFVRYASFTGSVNHESILHDTTGSRRYLVHEVQEIDYQHNVDMNRVWAQAYSLLNKGFKYFFDHEDNMRISAHNKRFEFQSSEEELLLKNFTPVEIDDPTALKMTASEILRDITGNSSSINNHSVSILGKVLKKHGFQSTMIRGSKNWRVRPLDCLKQDRGALFGTRETNNGEGCEND